MNPLRFAAACVVVLAVACSPSDATEWEAISVEGPLPDRSSWCFRFGVGLDRSCPDEGPWGGGDVGRRVTLSESEELTSYDAPVPPADDRTGAPAAIWWRPDGDPLVYVWDSGLKLYVERSDMTADEAQREYATFARECPGVRSLAEVGGGPALAQDVGSEPGCSSDLALVEFLEQGLRLRVMSPFHTSESLLDVAEDIEWS